VQFRINNPDNRAVGRRVVAFKRKTRFFSPTPEDQFTDARADRIEVARDGSMTLLDFKTGAPPSSRWSRR